jgi:hypothetical protein
MKTPMTHKDTKEWPSPSATPDPLQDRFPEKADSEENIECEVVLDQDFAEINGVEENFKEGLVGDLTRAAQGAQHSMKIKALRAGSVIADVVIMGMSPDGRSPLDTVHVLQSQIGQADSELMRGKYTSKVVSLRVKEPKENTASTIDDRTQSCVGLICHENHTLGYPRIFVSKVKPDSSAADSGRIKAGDLLAVIDGESSLFPWCVISLVCHLVYYVSLVIASDRL